MRLLRCIVVMAVVACASVAALAQSSDMDKRRRVFVELGYMAGSFDDVKGSGHYGWAFTFLPWKLCNRLYAGLNMTTQNFNYGLGDRDYLNDMIMAGPALGVYFTPQIALAMPLDVVCKVDCSGNDLRPRWGLALAPTMYLGKKVGVYSGQFFSLRFGSSDGSKFSTGFRAGFYF